MQKRQEMKRCKERKKEKKKERKKIYSFSEKESSRNWFAKANKT